jgi:hypothetical protein
VVIGNWELQLASLKISWDWLNLAKDGTSEFFFTPKKMDFAEENQDLTHWTLGLTQETMGFQPAKLGI